MTEENNEKVEDKVEEIKEQVPAEVKEEKETQEQINWKKFREAREKERKEKQEAEKRAAEKEAEAKALKAAMEELLNRQSPQASQNDYYEETEDERVKKLVAAELKAYHMQIDQQRAQQEQQQLPQTLNRMFGDFDKVCTESNLDYFEYHYPEIAAAYSHMPDNVEKWSNIYKAVKRFVPNIENQKEMARAEKNLSKPQSMSAAGKSQTGDTAPIMIDDARRKANWERMQRVLRGGS